MNAPTELELLREIASAAAWAIASNGDDAVGRDGRVRVGINWVAANGTLNRALTKLREHYELRDFHAVQREEMTALEAQMRSAKKPSKRGVDSPSDAPAAAAMSGVTKSV